MTNDIEYVWTDNKGKLEIVKPFTFLRGIENRDNAMGRAIDEDGFVYKIYPAACTGDCYCFATARCQYGITL